MLGSCHSEETKRKISKTKRENPMVITEEYRKKISETSKGRKFTKESIEKRAKKLRGQKRTPKQKERMRKAALGRIPTKETRNKMSESQRLRHEKRLIPFDMYKDGKYLGRFLKQKDFCAKYDISNNSLGKLLSKRLNICKGYSGCYVI